MQLLGIILAYSNFPCEAKRNVFDFVHQGVLLGLSNTAGVLAGVFGTAATGYILQNGMTICEMFKIS